jgi:membrane protein DedA with SNARE-associated domain
VLEWFVTNGSNVLFAAVLVVCGLGVPIPEDIILLAAGAVTHRTDGQIWITIVVVVLAVLAGDSILFFMARRLGPRMITLWPFRYVLTEKRRARVRAMFEKRGAVAILIGRHVAGLRPCVFAMAGIEGMPYRKFIFWDSVGAMISVPALTLLGYFGSESLEYIHDEVATAQFYLVGALIVGVALYVLYRYVRNRMRKNAARETLENAGILPPPEQSAPVAELPTERGDRVSGEIAP